MGYFLFKLRVQTKKVIKVLNKLENLKIKKKNNKIISNNSYF